jgi:hypothetical protein
MKILKFNDKNHNVLWFDSFGVKKDIYSTLTHEFKWVMDDSDLYKSYIRNELITSFQPLFYLLKSEDSKLKINNTHIRTHCIELIASYFMNMENDFAVKVIKNKIKDKIKNEIN